MVQCRLSGASRYNGGLRNRMFERVSQTGWGAVSSGFASFPLPDGSVNVIVSEAGENGSAMLEDLRRVSGMSEVGKGRIRVRILPLTGKKSDRFYPNSPYIQVALPSENNDEIRIFLGDYLNCERKLQVQLLKMVFFQTFFPSLLAGEMFLFHGALAVTESGQGILLCGPSGVGKSTACRKLAGKMQTLAEDFILLSKFDGKWFAQAAPTWSVWGFDKEEIVVSDICKIVPLNYMVLLNRGEARLEEFGKYGASLALSASFNDMTNWQTRAAVVPRDMRRQLRTCAFEGVLDMTKKLSCYRMFSKLDTDIGELLAVLK